MIKYTLKFLSGIVGLIPFIAGWWIRRKLNQSNRKVQALTVKLQGEKLKRAVVEMKVNRRDREKKREKSNETKPEKGRVGGLNFDDWKRK